MPEVSWTRRLRRIIGRGLGRPDPVPPHPNWVAVQQRLAAARTIVDLGCGAAPVEGATAAVDRFLAPEERSLGAGAIIDPEAMHARGIRFVNSRIDVPLPFADKEFDLAYSSHVFEHLEDPVLACREMQRIARAGVIITPSILAEHLFGRPYHRWLVMDRDKLLLFFRKRPFEDRPFGEHPEWDEAAGRYRIRPDTNVFDMLLNESGWYRGPERAPRLQRRLRQLWFSHAPVMEMIFLWDEDFDCQVYD